MLRDFLKKTITILLVVMMITQYLPHSASGEGLSGSDISQGGISSIWHDLFGFGDAESKSAGSKSTESKSTESNDVEVDTNEKANSNNDSVETEDKNEPADQIEVGEPTDTVVSVSEKDESLTPLYQNLIIDVSDNLGGKVNAVEFKLTQTSPKSNEANVRTGKTIKGKLVFNGLEKGEYLLETSKNLNGFDQTRLKYKVTASDDASIRVTDLLNNREASTTTGKESIVNNNLILSLEAKKTSGNIISIPISIQALKRDKLTRLSLYADLNEAFADQTYNISAGEGTYNSGKYKFTDISFDSSNKWTANIKLKIKDGKLDKADVKKIFENIYLDNDGKKVNITSPLLYMSEVVENTKLNVDLIRKEEPEVKPYKKTELPISPRSLTASAMSKSVDLDATDELPPVMLDSIIEATVNNALAASNGSELSDSDIRLLARSADLLSNGTGNLVVNKVDKADTTKKLKDADFKLYKSDKTTPVYSATSDDNGQAKFEGIAPGTYYLRETEEPEGYFANNTEWKVDVNAQGGTTVSKTLPQVRESEQYEGKIGENVVFKAKIVNVDYVKKEYTQIIYVNPTGTKYDGREPILRIRPKGSATWHIEGGVTKTNVEVSIVPASSLPDTIQDYEVLPPNQDMVDSPIVDWQYVTINFDMPFKKEGNAAIIKMTSKLINNPVHDVYTQLTFSAKKPNITTGNIFTTGVKRSDLAKDSYIYIKNDSSNLKNFMFNVPNEKTNYTNGKIEIDKIDDSNNNIAGAVFKLVNKSRKSRFQEVTTKAGQTEPINNIVPGEYTLTEISAPSGYIPTDEVWDVKVDTNGNVRINKSAISDSVVTYKGTNPIVGHLKVINKKARIQIKKVDSDSINNTLENAEFELYKQDTSGKKITTGKKAASTASGIVEYDSLEIGTTYWIKEITAPEGYVKEKLADGSDKYYGPFVIDARGNITNGEGITVRQPYIIGNKKANNKLLLKKVADDASKTPLEDAVFELYKDNGGNKVSTGIKTSSSSDGTFEFEALETGKLYWLKEVTAPIGYEKEKDASGDKYYGPFAIDNEGIARIGLGTDAQKADQPYLITNKKSDSRKGKFIIEKQDGDGNPLAGAEFKIYSADDNWTNLQELSATNYKLELNPAKNTFTFSDLKKGKYVVKESKAPNGYIVSTEVLKIEVMEDSQTKIVNAENFNRRVRRSVDGFESNSVSMDDPSRGSSGFFSLAARGISRFMSAGTSEVSPATRNTLGAARAPGSTRDPAISQLGLEQLYTEKPEPTAYKTDGEGEYPSPLVQSDPTVRNSNIPLDGLHWYESLYSRPNSGKPATNLQVAGVNKYAREAKDNSGKTIEGEYDVNLKTQGNLVNPDENVDIMLVYDNSQSMADTALDANGNRTRRFDVAKKATKEFIENVLKPENNPGGRVRMGLVTYATDIFDGEIHQSPFNSSVQRLPNYTYDNFSSNPNDIISKLPENVPGLVYPEPFNGTYRGIKNGVAHTFTEAYNSNPTWTHLEAFGGTFTSGAMKKASDILNDPSKSPPGNKKIILHITDGMPTISLKLSKVNGDGTVEFENENVNGETRIARKGDGSDYSLPGENYWYFVYECRYVKNGRNEYQQYIFTGTEAEVNAKMNELKVGNVINIMDDKVNYRATVTRHVRTYYNNAVRPVPVKNRRSLHDSFLGDSNFNKYDRIYKLHSEYNANGSLVRDHGVAAKGVAKNLISQGVEVFNLAVEIGDPSAINPKHSPVWLETEAGNDFYQSKYCTRLIDKKDANDVMLGMSSDSSHYYDVKKVSELGKILEDIQKRVPQRTIFKGQTTDPMGAMVDLKLPTTWKNGLTKETDDSGQETGYYMIYDGTKAGASLPSGFNFALTASNPALLKDVRVYYNPTTRTIKMNNYTLGKDEWINLSYKVNLRTTDPNYEGGKYYPTNGTTELQPHIDFERKWKYPVPSVMGPLNSIKVEKKWLDTDGNSIVETTPIKVKLQRRARDKIDNTVIIGWTDAKKTGTNDVMSLQLDSSSDWKGSFKNLLKYDTQYTYEYRVVEENVPAGYTSSIELTDTNGNVVNDGDGVKNGAGYAKITNTKSVRQIKVKKTWKTDENTDAKTVTVHLKAFKGDTNTPLKTSDLSASELNAIRTSGSTSPINISGQDVVITTTLNKANNWEAIFENLPTKTKETSTSKSQPIVYRVEEDQVDGYEVDYNYSGGTLGVVNYKVPKIGFKNEKNKIEFIKTDEKGNEIAEADLAVAKFVLKRTDEPGSAPINATRQGSKFIFEGLSPGTYELWEEVAPNNYDKPNTALTKFVVDQDGRIGTPVALHVINSSTTAPEDKYLKEDNGYKIKNYKKDMKFKFEKVAPIGPNSVTVLANGELKLELYKATSTSDESQKIDGVFANSYDLSQQRPETPFVVPITKNKVPSGIYYIKETQAPAGYAIGSDKIYIEVDWDNRTIKQVENPFDPANKRDVGQALYTEVNNGAGECLNILRIVNNRIELPRSGGIGPHVISLAGIGIMLAATFVYRRRVY